MDRAEFLRRVAPLKHWTAIGAWKWREGVHDSLRVANDMFKSGRVDVAERRLLDAELYGGIIDFPEYLAKLAPVKSQTGASMDKTMVISHTMLNGAVAQGLTVVDGNVGPIMVSSGFKQREAFSATCDEWFVDESRNISPYWSLHGRRSIVQQINIARERLESDGWTVEIRDFEKVPLPDSELPWLASKSLDGNAIERRLFLAMRDLRDHEDTAGVKGAVNLNALERLERGVFVDNVHYWNVQLAIAASLGYDASAWGPEHFLDDVGRPLPYRVEYSHRFLEGAHVTREHLTGSDPLGVRIGPYRVEYDLIQALVSDSGERLPKPDVRTARFDSLMDRFSVEILQHHQFLAESAGMLGGQEFGL